MIAVTAREVPEIRARMTDWARDPTLDGADNWFRFFLGPSPDGATESRVFDRVDDVGATIAGTLAVQLPAAELFYVSADMTDLARHAADTLTDYRLHPEDLPAQIGVMVYEHPPVEGTAAARHNAVSVVTWGPGRGGLWVHTWATTSPSQQGIVRIGRTLAQLPRDEVLERARTAAARNLPEAAEEFVERVVLRDVGKALAPRLLRDVDRHDGRSLPLVEFGEIGEQPGASLGVGRQRDEEPREQQQRGLEADGEGSPGQEHDVSRGIESCFHGG